MTDVSDAIESMFENLEIISARYYNMLQYAPVLVEIKFRILWVANCSTFNQT